MKQSSDEDSAVGSHDVTCTKVNVDLELGETSTKKKKTRGATVMYNVTRKRSRGGRRIITYNEDGIPIGKNGSKLHSFIGTTVHHQIPITYQKWKDVPKELKEKVFNIVEAAFEIDVRSRKSILRTASTAFRQFKNKLTSKHIMPFKDEPQLLENPPTIYAFIDINEWTKFVKSRLTKEFQELRVKQQERRGKAKYNHRLARKGYANVKEDLKKQGANDTEIQRHNLWKIAHSNKKGEIEDENVQEVVRRMDAIQQTLNPTNDKNCTPNDVLTQALGCPEYSGRVRGVGGFITPTTYFHTVKKTRSTKTTSEREQELIDETEVLRRRIKELEDNAHKSQFSPTSGEGSCSKRPSKNVEKREVKNEEAVIITKMEFCKESEHKVNKPVKKTSTKTKFIDLSLRKLPMSLTSIHKFAERAMDKDDSISFKLPSELFGCNRTSVVLREDIFDMYEMKEVKTLSLVAYMASLLTYCIESNRAIKYIFVDPSLISIGQYNQEVRARNLCSRFMIADENQLVIAPYNPGGHWSLVVIHPYKDLIYYLDSMRTSSRDDLKTIINMALTMYRAQKNLKAARKISSWKIVKCPLQEGNTECGYYVMRNMRDIIKTDSTNITDAIDTREAYTQDELDEVRVEWAEFLIPYL